MGMGDHSQACKKSWHFFAFLLILGLALFFELLAFFCFGPDLGPPDQTSTRSEEEILTGFGRPADRPDGFAEWLANRGNSSISEQVR